jgi:hypothetical protein
MENELHQENAPKISHNDFSTQEKLKTILVLTLSQFDKLGANELIIFG